MMVPVERIELPTFGLQNQRLCSRGPRIKVGARALARRLHNWLFFLFCSSSAFQEVLDLSQEALALETNIDRAKRDPSLELIVKLAKRLKSTPGKLLTPTD
jgi:hypothetical protein